jgi:DNA-binding transcriptional LysR family regulator
MNDVSANLQYVEVRLLRYAIAVAEELHFGRAAQRLHLSAPTLSKQIRQLERSLGYTLFVRRTREVVLTQGGIAFIACAREALSGIQRAVDRGAAAYRSEAGEISVAYSPWVRPSQLSSVKTRIAQNDSDVTLRLVSMQPRLRGPRCCDERFETLSIRELTCLDYFSQS